MSAIALLGRTLRPFTSYRPSPRGGLPHLRRYFGNYEWFKVITAMESYDLSQISVQESEVS